MNNYPDIAMLEYNSQLKKLILPEYGRNVQQMVDYCVAISDREERMRCANTIIQVMGNLFPNLRDIEDSKNKLWDHLAIMSDFQLDIDFPCEIIKKENLYTRPEKIDYHLSPIRYRHYGKIIENMIERAANYPEGEEKNNLISLVANHMKKLMFAINKEGVEDDKIFKDLYHYSHGKINWSMETHKLRVFKEAPQVSTGSSNKKNKKKSK